MMQRFGLISSLSLIAAALWILVYNGFIGGEQCRVLMVWMDIVTVPELAEDKLMPLSDTSVHQVKSTKKKDWDYLVFTQEWPPGYCFFHMCKFPKDFDNFNIHGLWPTIWPREEISECPGAPSFNASSLDPILPDLQREWANLKNFDAPLHFWRHEWTKHGSCAILDTLMSTEVDYFKMALKLKTQVNLVQALNRTGFIPSKTKLYKTEEIEAAMQKEFGFKSKIRCDLRHGIVAKLVEIRLCFNRSLKLIDCPEDESTKTQPTQHMSSTTECPETLNLLPFNWDAEDDEISLRPSLL